MDDPLTGLIAAACIVSVLFIAVIAIFSVRHRRRRLQQMRHWAGQHGWALTMQPDVDWGRRLPGGNRHGVGPLFSAVLHGRPVSVAEYSVTDAGDGTTVNTHHHVVTAARLSRSLPTTDVQPRGAASRLTTKILGPGEGATGHRDFDHRFRVRTSDPAVLREWFSAPLISAHLSGTLPVPWSVRGTEVLCHRPGRLNLDQIPAHAGVILALAALLDQPYVPHPPA
jgi:hypothetical protein